MRRFLLKLSLFLAIQGAVAIVMWVRGGSSDHDYLAVSLDKHRRAESFSEPRLLLVGDSSVAFGVDSPVMERALGRPTVNLAVHAGLGLNYILNEARDVMRPGDVVVLSVVYDLIAGESQSVHPVHFPVVRARPRSLAYMCSGEFRQTMDRGLVFLHYFARAGVRGPRPREKKGTIYVREAFNEQGDVVAHHDLPSLYDKATPTVPSAEFFSLRHLDENLARLNAFADDCQRNNVRLYFALAPVARDAFSERRSAIEKIDVALRTRLDCPVIGDLATAVMEPTMFFDTAYHLTWPGKQIHTSNLVAELAPQMRVDKATADAVVARAYGSTPTLR